MVTIFTNDAKMKSYIKVGLIVIVDPWLLVTDEVLWVENDIFLLDLIIEEV
jgi:hypothetical protein